MQVIEYFTCDRQAHWLEQVREIYISTNHEGLYEKYGCEFYQMMEGVDGEPSRVYRLAVRRGSLHMLKKDMTYEKNFNYRRRYPYRKYAGRSSFQRRV